MGSRSDLITPTLFCSKFVTARKQHRCCECGGVIERGESYRRNDGLWDDEFQCFKECVVCALLRNDNTHLESGFGELHRDLAAC